MPGQKNSPKLTEKKLRNIPRQHIMLAFDLAALAVAGIFIFSLYPVAYEQHAAMKITIHAVVGLLCFLGFRRLAKVYQQVWRYIYAKTYIRLILADMCTAVTFYLIQKVLPLPQVGFIRIFSVMLFSLFMSVTARLVYQYLYDRSRHYRGKRNFFWKAVNVLVGRPADDLLREDYISSNKIKVAIIGAGSVGASLAEELMDNPKASYVPCCFMDIDRSKAGRAVAGIPVLEANEASKVKLADMGVQEVIFAMPNVDPEHKKELYESYKQSGYKIKVYDYPVMRTADKTGKRHLREFDIEELLFRKPIVIRDEKTLAYYKNKVILITGGGGSIGSELCRQIAKMEPKTLVILDVYENGAYEIQQELRIAYGKELDLHVEILSVCDVQELEKVFVKYHPDVILHAAAHKHVPLMEHNCCEAVKNNVFGTLNVVKLAEKYKVGRFIMVSTDKAVNPTNVMGATKRMCEMIVQSHSRIQSDTIFSATRFGNVLGSAGSVIPLFKKQIMNGGPITLTDKRIIRYFMTIPEASQLVLQSGPMAKSGELFVLDMGQPVKILDLAENMVRLSGYEPYQDIQIIETGLRPGEKLYEELLIKTDELDKTDNNLIFIERDVPLPVSEVEDRLCILHEAAVAGNEYLMKEALKTAVPTFKSPDEVNREAAKATEMQMVKQIKKAAL